MDTNKVQGKPIPLTSDPDPQPCWLPVQLPGGVRGEGEGEVAGLHVEPGGDPGGGGGPLQTPRQGGEGHSEVGERQADQRQ